MEEKRNILTYAGLKAYEEELNDLRINKRKDIAEKIKEARGHGDLSENAEYDAALDEQRDVEARIEELQNLLKNAEIVDEDEVDVKTIGIGCKVKLQDQSNKEEIEYSIVGSSEANSTKHKISNESPLGMALVGAKRNEVVEVETQAGVFKYKVLKIGRAKA